MSNAIMLAYKGVGFIFWLLFHWTSNAHVYRSIERRRTAKKHIANSAGYHFMTTGLVIIVAIICIIATLCRVHLYW